MTLMTYIMNRINTLLTNESIDRSDCFQTVVLPTLDKNDPKPMHEQYVSRLVTHLDLHISTILLGFVYIDRLANTVVGKQYLKGINSHIKIFATIITIASKYVDDVQFSKDVIGRIIGIGPKEHAFLEIILLAALEYRLYVSDATIRQVTHQISIGLHDDGFSAFISSNFY